MRRVCWDGVRRWCAERRRAVVALVAGCIMLIRKKHRSPCLCRSARGATTAGQTGSYVTSARSVGFDLCKSGGGRARYTPAWAWAQMHFLGLAGLARRGSSELDKRNAASAAFLNSIEIQCDAKSANLSVNRLGNPRKANDFLVDDVRGGWEGLGCGVRYRQPFGGFRVALEIIER